MDAIALSLFASRIAAVCEEVGAVLARAAVSPNIEDRLDYSCAIFDVANFARERRTSQSIWGAWRMPWRIW